ncbi:MAG: putative lipid II flippase FtsW [Oscillospiraceae bacterium]|nr:putative lipid II flippase FtsW [Oscillospiraceae bacterium]
MQNGKRKNETRAMPPTSPAKQARTAGFDAKVSSAAQTESFFENFENFHRKRIIAKRETPDYTNLSRKQKYAASGAISGGIAVASPAMSAPRVKRKQKVRRERLAKFDFTYFTIVIIMLALGIVTMFSASYAYSFRLHGDSYFYVTRQLMFIGLGLAVMFLLSRIDYHIMLNKHIIRLGATISLGLMCLVAIMGTAAGGAVRWLEIGGTTFQPSEMLKFAVIVVMAYWMHTKYSVLKEFKRGFLPILIFLLFACGITLAQPHLSGAIIIFSIGFIMMFVGDCKVLHITLVLLAFAVIAGLGVLLLDALGYDYFNARILSWQNPEADVRGATFQTFQSLITIGSGGIFGLGLGNSRQKYAYLPASHNDFIFSIVCEELGFVGAILVILLFVLFVARGYYIAVCARDKFGMLLAVGITSQLGIQALLNIGVVTNSLPNTGISLPFFSYGGSALVMQMAGIGVVLNISRKAAIE